MSKHTTAGVIQMEGNDVDVYLLDPVAWDHISERKADKYEQEYRDWCRKMLRVIEDCGVHKTWGRSHPVPVYKDFLHDLEIVDKENSCTWLVSFSDNMVAVSFTNGSKELIVPMVENPSIVNKIKRLYTNSGVGYVPAGKNLLAALTSAPEQVILSDRELADMMHICVINVEFSQDMQGFWPVPPKGCRKDSAKITVPETTLSFPKPSRGRSK